MSRLGASALSANEHAARELANEMMSGSQGAASSPSEEQTLPADDEERQRQLDLSERSDGPVTEDDSPAPEESPTADEQATDAVDDEAEGTEQDTAEPQTYPIDEFAKANNLSTEQVLEMFTVKRDQPDGTTKEITLADALAGHDWNASLTQRSQKMAEQEKALEESKRVAQELHDAAEGHFTEQATNLTAEFEALEKRYQATDWEGIREQGDGKVADVEAWFQRQHRALAQRYQAIQGDRDRLVQQRQEAREAWREKNAPAMQADLLARVPEWSDSTVRDSESGELVTYLRGKGLTDRDLDELNHSPVAIELARRAMLQERGVVATEKARKVVQREVQRRPGLTLRPGQAGGQANARRADRDKKVSAAISDRSPASLAALVLHDLQSARRQ